MHLVMRGSAMTGLVLLGLAAPAGAEMDHAGMAMSETSVGHAPSDLVVASVGLVAASFSTPYFVGSYQGEATTVSWTHGRVGVAASLPVYHLDENGLGLRGLGDAMLHANADLAAVPWGRVGVMAMVSVPTADGQNGLGMGHWMAMPSVWTTTQIGRVALVASVGFSRSLSGLEDMRGPLGTPMVMSIVDPMNMSEITWSGGAAVALGGGVAASAHAMGGHPVEAAGVERVIGAGRLGWSNQRVSTGVELQAGLAGDPFTLRGIVDTAVRF